MIEPHFHYWPGIRNVPLPIYLMGYWQSELYFADVTQIIRNDFTFRQPLSGRNQELAEEISAVNAVSLHVRRGDYAKNPKTKAVHRLCPLSYYEAAIRYIAERVEEPHFFVFSDDIANSTFS
ncbi:alpha-1,2-fucosyltransferase [Thermosynechococcus sp. PP45]|uniref:alpha-1,2-fucosyltransferase n=1 Tax=unclassified Thermosynechococcus TaxID=2622553 RepID=UPI002671629C|nr:MULTISPECIES: alpha-1,2-fucosyltransferase [unclassified Thermosynechococcus]WKT80102.1 alpha-1,2-fucosyltransferase [Thermosynechococcus sp. PP45]WNC23712.1 alpha-1,2-fucosyltransferase [Thermosynechococcus sp. PP551]WNC26288.1 alpha-1,2-fucosyltransferase [Thermosynechococcus sp. PP555]